jgi:hypothetical protein
MSSPEGRIRIEHNNKKINYYFSVGKLKYVLILKCILINLRVKLKAKLK